VTPFLHCAKVAGGQNNWEKLTQNETRKGLCKQAHTLAYTHHTLYPHHTAALGRVHAKGTKLLLTYLP